MSHVVWGKTPVLLYNEIVSGDGSPVVYKLAKVSLVHTPIKHLPETIPDVSSLSGISLSYQQTLRETTFCYVLRPDTPAYIKGYSMRDDGSLLVRTIPPDDRGLQEVLLAPWGQLAGSDEICRSRPGPKLELMFDSTITTYFRQRDGSLGLFACTPSPCDRVRFDGIVDESCYETRQHPGFVLNPGILDFQSYLKDWRDRVIFKSKIKAQIVVVEQDGELVQYREHQAGFGGRIVKEYSLRNDGEGIFLEECNQKRLRAPAESDSACTARSKRPAVLLTSNVETDLEWVPLARDASVAWAKILLQMC